MRRRLVPADQRTPGPTPCGLRRIARLLGRAVAATLAAVFAPDASGDGPIQPGKVGTGSFVASGTTVTTEIGTAFYPATDSDDHVIDGYAGQTLTVSVTATAKSALVPSLQRLGPDGSLVVGRALHLLRFEPSSTPGDLGDFQVITQRSLPRSRRTTTTGRRGSPSSTSTRTGTRTS